MDAVADNTTSTARPAHRAAKKKAHHLLHTGYKKLDVYKFES